MTSGCSVPRRPRAFELPSRSSSLVPEKRCSNPPCPRRIGEAGQQHVPCVRAQDLTRCLGPVQRQGVGAEPLAPERLLEALAERCGDLLQFRSAGLVTQCPGDRSAAAIGAVGIGLDFDQGDRALRQPPVRMAHRILAILPALVQETLVIAPAVLDEAVAVPVAMVLEPCNRLLDRWPQLAGSRKITRALE